MRTIIAERFISAARQALIDCGTLQDVGTWADLEEARKAAMVFVEVSQKLQDQVRLQPENPVDDPSDKGAP